LDNNSVITTRIAVCGDGFLPSRLYIMHPWKPEKELENQT
jgi:hypothetical protein